VTFTITFRLAPPEKIVSNTILKLVPLPAEKHIVPPKEKESIIAPKIEQVYNTPGFVILGMHRSGTSYLSGLLTIGCQYNVGDNLMQNKPDNPKGFFERWDVANQNENWFGDQRMGWESKRLIKFDLKRAFEYQNPWKTIVEENVQLSREKNKTNKHKYPGMRTLDFMLNPQNVPWLVKEPRLCITYNLWLDMFDQAISHYSNQNGHKQINRPAIIFTYRHPIEVAESIYKRDRSISINHGLQLWLIYNQRALEHSSSSCRIYSSNTAITQNPLLEIRRISQELTNQCGVPPPPKQIEQQDINQFFEDRLQHNTKTPLEYDNEDCFDVEYENVEVRYKRLKHTKDAIQVFCDLKFGVAFEPDYQWPFI